MMQPLFPIEFNDTTEKAVHNHLDQCMPEWIQACGDISSLFEKFSVLCQAANPSVHELANLNDSFKYYTRHSNPVINFTMIKGKGNLC